MCLTLNCLSKALIRWCISIGLFSSTYHLLLNKRLTHFLFIFVVAIAISLPQLGNSIALVGSLAGSAVLFVFPALLHLLVVWKYCDLLATRLAIAKDIFIMVIGVLGAIVGTYQSLAAIIRNYNISPTIANA